MKSGYYPENGRNVNDIRWNDAARDETTQK